MLRIISVVEIVLYLSILTAVTHDLYIGIQPNTNSVIFLVVISLLYRVTIHYTTSMLEKVLGLCVVVTTEKGNPIRISLLLIRKNSDATEQELADSVENDLKCSVIGVFDIGKALKNKWIME